MRKPSQSFLLCAFLMGATCVQADERRDSATNKIDFLLELFSELKNLNQHVDTVSFRTERLQNITTITTQIREAQSRMKAGGATVSDEHLSGWKTGFFGARFLICNKIEEELRKKKHLRFHLVHRDRKPIFEGLITEFNNKCDATGKVLGNMPLDQSFGVTINNLHDLEKLAKDMNKLF